jgi:prepilin-type processing-associated H-X9-DG protein
LSVIEILVVMGIISLLIGLLLPGVQRIRATASKLSCQSRLRQLALAVHQYSDANGQLPVGCDYPFATDEQAQRRQVGISWHTSILPFVEQDSLWQEAWEVNRRDPTGSSDGHLAVRAHIVSVFLCPAESRSAARNYSGGQQWALTDYVGVAGTGVHNNDGVLHPGLRVRFADITDGTSNTLMIGERPASPSGQFSGWYASWGQSPCAISQVLGTRSDNIVLSGARDCSADRSPLRPGHPGSSCDQSHFWSLHPGGANFAIADGSARFLAYDRSPVIVGLATRSGGEVVPDD